jgi:hypothetical protein
METEREVKLKSSLDTFPGWARDYSSSMTKYLYRTCPKCKDYLGVVVRDPPGPNSEITIDAYCVVCGFKLDWKVVLGSATASRFGKPIS